MLKLRPFFIPTAVSPAVNFIVSTILKMCVHEIHNIFQGFFVFSFCSFADRGFF